MIELVQLERRHEDFARRNTRVIVVSAEGPDLASLTQEKNPHLLVLADGQLGLTKASGQLHEKGGPNHEDISIPTTILIDRQGLVRWIYRSGHVETRLSPDEVLQLVDEHLRAR
jgi:peroxiredoxin